MKCIFRISIMTVLITCLCTIVAFGQEAAASANGLLTVGGEVERPLNLSLADLSKLPRLSNFL